MCPEAGWALSPCDIHEWNPPGWPASRTGVCGAHCLRARGGRQDRFRAAGRSAYCLLGLRRPAQSPGPAEGGGSGSPLVLGLKPFPLTGEDMFQGTCFSSLKTQMGGPGTKRIVIKKKKFICWLLWVLNAACRLSLVAVSGCYSLVAEQGL